MTKTIPSYLRIHRGSEFTRNDLPHSGNDVLNRFWNAYAEATGWRIDRRLARQGAGVELLPAVGVDTLSDAASESAGVVSKAAAIQLAQSASQLAEELRENREAVRRQEAELASRAPILAGCSDRVRLADRIESTLSDVVAACHCDAAAVYMLDDDTQYLKARSVFGLPPQRLEQPPRPLRGSRGDLEAMVEGVVTIDDVGTGAVDTWNSPEPFASGICAAIGCDDVPIGTLWLFGNRKQAFGIGEAPAARMAASKLSLELSHASLSGAQRSHQAVDPIQDISQWQYETLPIGAGLADDWRADGMIESPRSWATGWHTWDVLPDGTLMLAIAEAVDSSPQGAMKAAVARAALAAHTGYRHTPVQLMQRISDTLWQISPAEQLVSMLYVRVDPENGEGEVAAAGSIAAMIGSRYGYRPLVDGRNDPLNAHIDASCFAETFRMTEGETLLAYTQGLISDGASQVSLGEQVRLAMQSDDVNPLARIRRSLAGIPLNQERGAVTLLRQLQSSRSGFAVFH